MKASKASNKKHTHNNLHHVVFWPYRQERLRNFISLRSYHLQNYRWINIFESSLPLQEAWVSVTKNFSRQNSNLVAMTLLVIKNLVTDFVTDMPSPKDLATKICIWSLLRIHWWQIFSSPMRYATVRKYFVAKPPKIS